MTRFICLHSILLSLVFVAGMFISANALAQESAETIDDSKNAIIENSEYTAIENYSVEAADPNLAVKRILTDVGFGILYDFSIFITWFMLMPMGMNKWPAGLPYITAALGFGAASGLAVHTSDAIWGGMGSIGWTYAGAAIGTAGGALLGSAAFLSSLASDFDGVIVGLATTIGLAAVGGIVGAILGYEITDTKNAESTQFAIRNVRPVIELSKERNVFGVGFDF